LDNFTGMNNINGMSLARIKRILALAPHPHDLEFTCGYTFKKLTNAKTDNV